MAAVGCLPRCQAAAGVKQEHVTCWPKVFLQIIFGTFWKISGMVVRGGSHSEPNKWKMAGRFPKWLPLDKIWLIKNPLSPTHRVWRMEATFQSQLLDTTIYQTKNIEVSGWLYQIKTHFTHIVYQPFSRVSPPFFTLYGVDHQFS